jgi:hypothetical protein
LAGRIWSFSIGKSEIPKLNKYIAGQKEHHRKRTFQEELIAFFDEYGIATMNGTCGNESAAEGGQF